jgi:hypothetical protein
MACGSADEKGYAYCDCPGGRLRMIERDGVLQAAQKGCPARPQRARRRGVPLRYIESLSDARTKLADFFSSLLGLFLSIIECR